MKFHLLPNKQYSGPNYQTTHHDLWDRDNGSPPNLVTISRDGRETDAVALVTKMGYLFMFDRETGESLFEVKEVPVDTVSSMPGEKPWPTQPIPVNPPFTRQGYQEQFMFNRGGAIATAGGLIFIGATGDNMFRAFDQKTGKVLWEHKLPGMASSIPSTYAVGNKQYVVVSVNRNKKNDFKEGYISFAMK